MREIKFRAWDYLNNKMLDPIDIEDRTLRQLDGDNDQAYMQYTGLQDKNGRDIYEGDIIEAPETAVDGKFIDEVVWGKFNDCCVEGYTWVTKQNRWQPAIWYYEGEIEVIGNIYETPDLLTLNEE